MTKFRGGVRRFFGSKWVKFAIATIVWVLWFVVWSRNLWMLLGIVFIFDIYISKLMYRAFWRKHKERKAANKSYREVWGWIEALVFATIVASIIHIYVFQMYVIPSSSMEKTLLVGDYLWVSKVAYGPKMPNTPVAFPFVHHTLPFSRTKKSYSEAVKLPYKRLAGFGPVERGDIVVFNFPAGDTVLLEQQDVTYYDVLREYESAFGPQLGRKKLNEKYTVVSRPVDKREHYVKRAVAVPGDTIEIRHSEVYINGRLQAPPPEREFLYFIQTNGTPIGRRLIEEMELAQDDVVYNPYTQSYTMPLTDRNAERIRSMGNIAEIRKFEETVPNRMVIPHDETYGWNQDNFGPLWVPARGASVPLTPETLPLYRRAIEVYEGNEVAVGEDGTVLINGYPSDTYTFKLNYYFMMGDNRHNSADSRFWGFVPEDHVVGRPSFIWFSSDKDKSFPSNIRWNRIFRKVG